MDAPSPPTSSSMELTISFPPSPSSGDQGRMRNLDINQIPEDGGEDDQQWMSALITSNTTTYSTIDLENNHQVDDSINGGGSASSSTGWPPRKKLRLSKHQSQLLEDSFRLNPSLNLNQKEALGIKLNMTPRQVEVWFQNRRARSKLKQTEMECEYLRRWFASLNEQNRHLQKEVAELRASKVDPPTVLFPNTTEPLPASALSMCPHCQRITASTPNSAAKEPLDEK